MKWLNINSSWQVPTATNKHRCSNIYSQITYNKDNETSHLDSLKNDTYEQSGYGEILSHIARY